MKFINLSPAKTQDFYLKFQSQLDILMKNVLYLTHEVDHIKKLLIEITHDNGLQKQVDEYFEETSPQTDPVQEISDLQYKK